MFFLLASSVDTEGKPDSRESASLHHNAYPSCRKVGHVLFNPAAENVLASASGDYTIKIWDLKTARRS